MRPAVWAALLVVGCKGMFGDSSRIIALEIVGPATDTVQAGDTLQLHARALSASGDTVAGAVVEWAILDTGTVRIALDPATGTVVADSAGTWHLQASVENIRSDPVALRVLPAPASLLAVTGIPDTVTAGAAATVVVTALDPFNNTAAGYTGTVSFTSSDTAATLPGAFTFSAAAAGTYAFTNGVTLRTPGQQSVTARDTLAAGISGSQSGIVVIPISGSSGGRRP